MSDKMTILFVKDTGHVVAALTREADAEAKLTADILAGETLALRYLGVPNTPGYGTIDFLFASDELDVLIPDFDAGVISNPRGFVVDRDKKVQPANSSTVVSPSFLTASQIQIAVGAAVLKESKVRVEVVDATTMERQVVTAAIAAGGTQVDVDLRPVDHPAFFNVLTLVQGFELDRQILNTT